MNAKTLIIWPSSIDSIRVAYSMMIDDDSRIFKN